MKAWFVSDIHLKSLNERNGNILLRFLHSLATGERECTHIFFLGDIFDIWVGSGQFHYDRFRPIIDQILLLHRQGKKVVYFEGNHDVYVSDFWRKQLHIPCYVEDEYFQIGKKTVRLSHGDQINPHDKPYERYRRFYRHPLTEKVIRKIPEKAFYEFGIWASRTSRSFSAKRRDDGREDLRQLIRNYAEKCYSEKPFQYIISGHMHVTDEYQFKDAISINLGSWFDRARVLSLNDQGHEWVELD